MKDFILKELKRCIEYNNTHPLEDTVTKIPDIKIFDVFTSVACDEEGMFTRFFTIDELVDLNNEIILVECSEDGYYHPHEFDDNEYYILNNYVNKPGLLEKLVKELELNPM